MEAWLVTLLAVALILGACYVLAQTWPHSYRRSGFHLFAGRGDDASDDAPDRGGRDAETGLVPPEDDDFRWPWRDRPGRG